MRNTLLAVAGLALAACNSSNQPVVVKGALAARVFDQPGVIGQLVVLDGSASTGDGPTPLTYAWTVTDPSSAAVTLSNDTSAKPSFIAKAAGSYKVSLTVSQGSAASQPATATVFVTSKPVQGRPPVAVVTWLGAVQPGATATLDGSRSFDPEGGAITYLWSLVQVPTGSTAALSSPTDAKPTLTPDKLGLYTAKLVVKNADQIASDPVITTFDVRNGPPTAVIAPVGRAIVFNPVTLDGSASTSPQGDAITYSWSLLSRPAGAPYPQLTVPGNSSTATFLAQAPGAYSVQLNTSSAAGSGPASIAHVTFTVEAPTSIATSGTAPPSSATVGSSLGTLKVKATLADGTAAPNIPLTWRLAGLIGAGAAPSTDAKGEASVALALTRIAGPATLEVSVTSLPSVKQTLAFTGAAGQPTTINLSIAPGSVDTGALVHVATVDQYGNPSSSPATATGRFSLTAQGSAVFDTTVVSGAGGPNGALVTDGGTNMVVGQLANGVFEILLKGKTAGDVPVSLEANAGTSVLPFSAFSTILSEDMEGGSSALTPHNGGSFPNWNIKPVAETPGGHSAGIELGSDQVTSYGYSIASVQLSANQFNASAPITRIHFRHKVDDTFQQAPNSACLTGVTFSLAFSGCQTTCDTKRGVTPVQGWDVIGTCDTSSGGVSFAGSSAGWSTATFDLTDLLFDGTYPYLQLRATNVSNYNQNLPKPASWYVDNLVLESLGPPQISVLATARLSPGAPKAFKFPSSTLDVAPVYRSCPTTPAPAGVTVRLVDQYDNVVPVTSTVKVNFSGSNNPTLVQVPVGIPVGAIGGGSQVVQLSGGVAVLLVATSVPGPVSVSLSDVATTGYDVSSTATAISGATYVCHNDGVGEQWADSIATGTYDATEALRACETHYGPGNCDVGGGDAFPIANLQGTCSANYRWTYSAHGFVDNCNIGRSLQQGKTSVGYISTVPCGCGGPMPSPGVNGSMYLFAPNNRAWN